MQKSATKWESAVNGAKTFAETLLNKVNNAQIALVGFSNDAKPLREFANTNLDSTDFGSEIGRASCRERV